jgi:hypothetical protein
VDYGVYHLDYPALNANLSGSWSHALDAGALLVGALVCLAGAWRSQLERATWVAVAVVLALFTVDEVSSLHAEIGGSRYGKLLYAPILAVLVYGVCTRSTCLTPTTSRGRWDGGTVAGPSSAWWR